jgi:hypothetical protein
MNKVEAVLRSALSRVDSSDPDKRLRVYNSAVAAMERLDGVSRSAGKRQLTEAIRKLEFEFNSSPRNLEPGPQFQTAVNDAANGRQFAPASVTRSTRVLKIFSIAMALLVVVLFLVYWIT